MSTATAGTSAPDRPQGVSLRRSSPRVGERIIYGLLFACGAVSVLTTAGIILTLFVEAAGFFRDVSIVEFFTASAWTPFGGLESGSFGIRPLVTGTLLVTGIALIVAVPLGLGAAMYLSDYAPRRVRAILKPALEVLAGVPTIVLGFFALTFVTPLLRSILGETVEIFNAASGGILIGIMIIPTIASISEDAMSAVPSGLRESAYGLGATRRKVVTSVVVPAALSGIVASIILGLGRAIGETMIVAIATGNLPSNSLNPFKAHQTMTAYVVQAVAGEAPRGSLSYESIFAVGALLFVITFGLNLLAQRFVRRFREVY